MCLAIPGKIIEKDDEGRALVDFGGVRRTVQTDLLPGVKPGDYVIVHAGFAIHTLSAKDARKTLRLVKQAFPAPQDTSRQ